MVEKMRKKHYFIYYLLFIIKCKTKINIKIQSYNQLRKYFATIKDVKKIRKSIVSIKNNINVKGICIEMNKKIKNTYFYFYFHPILFLNGYLCQPCRLDSP